MSKLISRRRLLSSITAIGGMVLTGCAGRARRSCRRM